jgi:large subunit ribosomal protein L13
MTTLEKTFAPKGKEINRDWFVVDATDKVLGRLATEIARILLGKHKPIYAPFIDTGDHVVVINAEKVRVTGKKSEQKRYYRHTGYPGGIRVEEYRAVLEKHPERIVQKAVRGMLPHNTLGRQMFKKLRVYAGPEHRHQAQKPTALDIG